jgi:hypothetical protein
VNQRPTTRSKLPYYSFAFLGLAVLIFTWGLQYKLSLYAAPNSAVRHMIHAKLLANDEQPTVPDHALIGVPSDSGHVSAAFVPGALLVPLLAFSLLLAASEQSQEVRASERPWHTASQAGFSAFFFRPPPARF